MLIVSVCMLFRACSRSKWTRKCSRSHLKHLKYSRTTRRLGLRHGPHWESLQRFPRPSSWWREASCTSPKPRPRFGPSGLRLRPFGPCQLNSQSPLGLSLVDIIIYVLLRCHWSLVTGCCCRRSDICAVNLRCSIRTQ